MNLLKQTQELCKQYGIKPARSKGQNFLINEDIFDRIVEISDVNNNDIVLEVGSGLGFMTQKIASKVREVVAVELDDKLASFLQAGSKIKKINNITIINQDVLDIISNIDLKISDLIKKLKKDIINYKVVANLPYNITSVFLRKIFSLKNKPTSLTLMLQKEVAERIVAKPGKMSKLAVSVQFYAEVEIVEQVSRNDFWPAPEVNSAVIHLTPHPPLLVRRRGVSERDFFRLVKFGFSAKRKMFKNNLSVGFKITQSEAEERIVKLGFNPKIRAQELSLDDWGRLYGEFY